MIEEAPGPLGSGASDFFSLHKEGQINKEELMTNLNPTVNLEQRLFVIPSGDGVSCLGFDVVFRRLRQYAEKLGWAPPAEKEVGTLKQFEDYSRAESAYIATKPQETQFDPGTPLVVAKLLDELIKRGHKVRLYYGDATTGRDWLQEFDTIGRMSRSMGPLKVPLLVPDRHNGGPQVLTACIVRIQDSSGRDLWRHAGYHQPTFKIQSSEVKGYVEEAVVDSVVHARFKKAGQASRWIEFMRGNRMTK